jgi:hypothetical protein
MRLQLSPLTDGVRVAFLKSRGGLRGAVDIQRQFP